MRAARSRPRSRPRPSRRSLRVRARTASATSATPLLEAVDELDVVAHARDSSRRDLARLVRVVPQLGIRGLGFELARAAPAPRRCAGTRARRATRRVEISQVFGEVAHDVQLSARGTACTSCRSRRSRARCGPASSRPAPAAGAAAGFSATAPARVAVATGAARRPGDAFGGRRPPRLRIALAPWTGSSAALYCTLRNCALRLLVDHDLEVEHVADEVVLDLAHHRFEHVEALALPLGERVAAGPWPGG